MISTRGITAAAAMLALLIGSGPAWGALCYTDSSPNNPGSGVPVKWKSQPIDVYWYIPATGAKLPADKAAVEAAIKAAFDAFAAIECTDLAFNYAGAIDPLVSEKAGAILVFFGHDASTWIHGDSAYFYTMNWGTVAEGDIKHGVIGMNAGKYDWVIGKEAQKIDIQTAVMKMIPGTLGYYVGSNPATGSLDIKFDTVDHTVSADQATGAKYTYFKNDANCTQPAAPPICTSGTPPGDGGGPPPGDGDGGAQQPDGGTQPRLDGAVPQLDGSAPATDGGGIGVDGGPGGGGGEDDGCCRVSHAGGSDHLPFLVLAGLALLIGLSRRRFRR